MLISNLLYLILQILMNACKQPTKTNSCAQATLTVLIPLALLTVCASQDMRKLMEFVHVSKLSFMCYSFLVCCIQCTLVLNDSAINYIMNELNWSVQAQCFLLLLWVVSDV